MNILAISTSDDRLSVALQRSGRLFDEQIITHRKHNQSVLVVLDRILTSAGVEMQQLDAIAFGVGPGSFTGLRIAAGVAQGIAFGHQLPVVPVSCMAAIAQKQPADKIIVALDAKRSQLCWGRYIRNEAGWVELDGEEKITPINELIPPGTDWIGAGDGWDLHFDKILTHSNTNGLHWIAEQRPHAREIALLGAVGLANGVGKPARFAIPNYLSPYLTN